MKKVLLISYHFYPDTSIGARRPTEFVKSLHGAGYSIDVLTLNRELSNSVDFVDRFYSINEYPDPINLVSKAIKKISKVFKKNKQEGILKVKKTFNQLSKAEKEVWQTMPESFFLKARRYILSFQASLSAKKIWILLGIIKLVCIRLKRKRYNIVITSSPPIAVNVLGLVAQRLFKAKWILDLRDPVIQWEDIYPECISAGRVKLEERFEGLYLGRSDLILVTTPSYKSELDSKCILKDFNKEIVLLLNGYDSQIKNKNIDIKRKSDVLNIIYAGSLYMNRDPFPFLLAIKNLIIKDIRKISVNFFGSCSSWKGIDMKKWLELNEISSYVTIHGTVDSDLLDEIYQDADILLVFAQGQPKQIPAKVFEYLPYSAPILCVSEKDADTTKLLSGIVSAYVVESDEKKIQKIILSIQKKELSENNIDEIKFFSRVSQNKLLIKECDRFSRVN
ncbi:MAG: hypothetical protein ACJA0H_000927 [Francisellaceae bacterium]|jgi:hypothetical protein